jgi:hypothetical protein
MLPALALVGFERRSEVLGKRVPIPEVPIPEIPIPGVPIPGVPIPGIPVPEIATAIVPVPAPNRTRIPIPIPVVLLWPLIAATWCAFIVGQEIGPREGLAPACRAGRLGVEALFRLSGTMIDIRSHSGGAVYIRLI